MSSGEQVTRVQYSDADAGNLWLERLEPGGKAYTWHHLLPERLVAAHEQAKAALQAAEEAVVVYVKDHDVKEVDPTW